MLEKVSASNSDTKVICSSSGSTSSQSAVSEFSESLDTDILSILCVLEAKVYHGGGETLFWQCFVAGPQVGNFVTPLGKNCKVQPHANLT